MATGHNRFAVVEDLSSHAFCKIVATVSPRRGYPELPDISDNPLTSYIYRLVVWHVWRDRRGASGVLMENLRRRIDLEGLGVDARIHK
jgi:hypothetical protein